MPIILSEPPSSGTTTTIGLPQYYIDVGDSVTIPSKFEMAIHDEFVVLGEIIILGRLILDY